MGASGKVLSLSDALAARVGQARGDLRATVLALSRIPYGRPKVQSPAGVLAEWRGTCSTKHLLLAAILQERWPELRIALWHRVYRVTKELAHARWGPGVAAIVPAVGLVDVHTYATIQSGPDRITLDVTFPLADWDGKTAIPLACDDGRDYAAGPDPLAKKAELVDLYCDPAVREPFIAALSES